MHDEGADANFEGLNPLLEPSDFNNKSDAKSVFTAGQRYAVLPAHQICHLCLHQV
jgi:hypothetical protein